jgi:hypothetical protein
VDAHKHFIPNGIGIDKEPPDKFIGEAVVLDVSTVQNGHGITSSNLEKYISIVKSGDIVFTLYWYVPNCIRTVWKIAIKMNMKRQGVILYIWNLLRGLDCKPRYKMRRNRYIEYRKGGFH